MADIRTRLRQTHDDIVPPPDVMGTLIGRRKRLERRKKDKRRKIASLIVGVVVVAAGIGVVVHASGSPSTSGGPTGEPKPVILSGARLSPGPHVLTIAGLQITIQVPEGWRGSDQGVVDSEFGADAPSGAGLEFWTVSNVYEDPCHWKSSAMQPAVGGSVNDLVRALVGQAGHPAGPRVKMGLRGFDTTKLEMQVPENLDISRCDNGEFHPWRSPQGDRYQQGPGQVDQLFITDVNGTRLVIDVSYFPGTSAKDREQVLEMFRSVEFG